MGDDRSLDEVLAMLKWQLDAHTDGRHGHDTMKPSPKPPKQRSERALYWRLL
jgi:hypothetical protein